MLPTFKNKPHEDRHVSPRIVRLLRKQGFEVYTGSLFDILVMHKNLKKYKHIELKVRFILKNRNAPISKKQWVLINNIKANSNLNETTRVLIYDGKEKRYGVFTLYSLKNHIQSKKPKTTSFISRLDELDWTEPETAWEILVEWINK